jgi:hypothetical protein
MGNIARARRHAEPPRSLYWVYRALLCLIVAPLIGVMVGIVSSVAGLLWGELAALIVLLFFMTDLFVRLVRGRRAAVTDEPAPGGTWDRELDG